MLSQSMPRVDDDLHLMRFGRVLRRVPVYPVALAIAIGFQAVAGTGTTIDSAIRMLVVSGLIGLGLTVAAVAVIKDRDRAALISALLACLIALGADARVLGLSALAIAIVALAGRRVPAFPWSSATRFGSIAVGILWVALGFAAVPNGVFRELRDGGVSATDASQTAGSPAAERPDVLLLLLDGYARHDVLKEQLGFDNGSFLDSLETDGFDVVERSRSNYATTVQSLASMLEMRPLEAIPELRSLLAGTEQRPMGAVVADVIGRATAMQAASSLGYETVAISAGYEETRIRRVDRLIDTGQLKEIELAILGRSVIPALLEQAAPDLLSAQFRDRIQGVLREATTTITDRHDRPRFVLGHVPSPHAPWVMHADGRPRTHADIRTWLDETPQPAQSPSGAAAAADAYVGQVAWLDDQVLALVDEVTSSSERPVLIAILSDHGTYLNAEGPDYADRFKNLLAIRRPDGDVVDRADAAPAPMSLIEVMPWIMERISGVLQPRYESTPSFIGAPAHPYRLRPVVVDDP
jgi:hypothetical protein